MVVVVASVVNGCWLEVCSKIVSKVLAWRLKEVLPTLIDERQTTFIEGQHLLHSTLIANEVIHEAKSINRSCLVFKADFEKAYDSVS